jgi:hypothetical protein
VLGRETSAARIFESKSAEDFEHKSVVSLTSKMFAWCGIVLMNLFFVYYTVLHGYQKGVGWQRSYLAGCVMQIIVEILLNETMECTWVNFFVPNLVASEVIAVSSLLHAAVGRLCSKNSRESRFFMDVPDYLFVSTNVAKQFPQLVESMIVRTYQTHIPGELSKKWHLGAVSSLPSAHNRRRVSAVGSLLLVLQVLGASPFVFQRIIIRVIQPWLLAGITLVIFKIAKSPLFLSLASLVVLAVGVYAGYSYFRERNNAKLSPGAQTHFETFSSDEEDEEEEGKGIEGGGEESSMSSELHCKHPSTYHGKHVYVCPEASSLSSSYSYAPRIESVKSPSLDSSLLHRPRYVYVQSG